jgi:AraC family transcriptional regulator, regulatory protein of adaptative response / methylated-DNA-[protein]-cysteine methyltransferase
MSDYERVAQVIRYLDRHHADHPDLATLAHHVGLSPYHFHRLFAAWAGVTPKDFLQCLTLAHVKQLLQEGKNVLDTSLAAGFSGPGRLHDLCVNLEAASPGEIKSGGQGWTIRFGFAETPFGECLLGTSPRGICHLAFVERQNHRAAQEALQIAWPTAKLLRQDTAAAQWAAGIFHRQPVAGKLRTWRAFVRGSTFQVRVWNALLRLPAGALVTYGQLAKAVGHPAAARAVGTAVGHNPLAYIIPCHRVIRETGLIGGYRWGPDRKRAIIAWETMPRPIVVNTSAAPPQINREDRGEADSTNA